MWEKKGSRCLSHICVTISIWIAQLQEHQLRVWATQTLFQHGHLSAVLMIWIKWLHLFSSGINMRLLTWDRNPHGSVHFEKKKEEKKKANITAVGEMYIFGAAVEHFNTEWWCDFSSGEQTRCVTLQSQTKHENNFFIHSGHFSPFVCDDGD